MKSLQKEQKAQIMEYKAQSAGINLQSSQSDSTPWTLTQKCGFQSKPLFLNALVMKSIL